MEPLQPPTRLTVIPEIFPLNWNSLVVRYSDTFRSTYYAIYTLVVKVSYSKKESGNA